MDGNNFIDSLQIDALDRRDAYLYVDLAEAFLEP